MENLPLTAFDVAVLLVMGLSVLVALVRGAVREVLALATWVGALAVAFYGFDYARELARKTIETPWMADAAALGVVFVVPLIGFKVVAAILAERVPRGLFGTLDRVVGVGFGLARGAVIVCAAYLGLSMLIEPADQPDWVRQAAVLPYVQDGADFLEALVPPEVAEQSLEAVEQARRQGRRLEGLGDAAGEIAPK